MLEGVYGCFMTCNIILAGNSEVSLELQYFRAELITYIVCECDAPECQRLPELSFQPCEGKQRIAYNPSFLPSLPQSASSRVISDKRGKGQICFLHMGVINKQG